MKLPLLLCSALLLLTACGERGDKAIAYGSGTGADWKPSAPGQMMITAQNLFTRDVVIVALAPGKHYEMTVGPIRERYMIVPDAKYKIEAWTGEKRASGVVHLYVGFDKHDGYNAIPVKIRP